MSKRPSLTLETLFNKRRKTEYETILFELRRELFPVYIAWTTYLERLGTRYRNETSLNQFLTGLYREIDECLERHHPEIYDLFRRFSAANRGKPVHRKLIDWKTMEISELTEQCQNVFSLSELDLIDLEPINPYTGIGKQTGERHI